MSLVNLLALMLDAREREAVLGDLAECAVPPARAFWETAGLVVRRQAEQWKDWRPWVGAGVMLPAAWYLSIRGWRIPAFNSVDWWIVSNYKDLDPAVLAENGYSLHGAIWEIFRGWTVVPAEAWAAGFLVGFLARRTSWVHATILATLLFYPLWFRWPVAGIGTVLILTAVVLAPALAGLRFGRRKAAA